MNDHIRHLKQRVSDLVDERDALNRHIKLLQAKQCYLETQLLGSARYSCRVIEGLEEKIAGLEKRLEPKECRDLDFL